MTDRPEAVLRKDQSCKTLVLCPIGLGNFIMATPALGLLSQEIGQENLHLVALKPGIKTMAEATGFFHAVHQWDPDKEGMGGGVRMLASLRKLKFDYSISLFPTGDPRFTLFALLAGPKQRVGFDYPNSTLPKRLQTLTIPLDLALHDTDQNWVMMERLLGTQRPGPRRLHFDLEPTHPEYDRLRGLRYFVCHPGSSAERRMVEKRLPPAGFANIINRIYREHGLQCILIGGPEEEPLREEIRKVAGDAILDFSSKSLNELAALIVPAQFYMGNDSGLMHVSVALGKRCIAFFGPSDDRRNGPYSDALRDGRPSEHLIVRREDLECSPCWSIRTVGANPACIYGDIRCLKDMEVERVWPKIDAFIKSIAATPQAPL